MDRARHARSRYTNAPAGSGLEGSPTLASPAQAGRSRRAAPTTLTTAPHPVSARRVDEIHGVPRATRPARRRSRLVSDPAVWHPSPRLALRGDRAGAAASPGRARLVRVAAARRRLRTLGRRSRRDVAQRSSSRERTVVRGPAPTMPKLAPPMATLGNTAQPCDARCVVGASGAAAKGQPRLAAGLGGPGILRSLPWCWPSPAPINARRTMIFWQTSKPRDRPPVDTWRKGSPPVNA
jgi:hypothetical protein